MADEVIKSFLVSLNYKVDDASKKKFENSAASAEKSVSGLAKAMSVAAVAFVAGVTKIAGEMERMQIMSQRLGASASNIKSFQYAISQMGGSASEAAGSLESLAQKLRTSPGYYSLLNRLGVQTRTANGGLRDTVEIVGDLAKSLNNMPYPRAAAYANVLGIDEKTLLAIKDGSLLEKMEKYQQMRKSVGLGKDVDPAGRATMQELRDLGTMTLLIFERISTELAKVLLPILTRVNKSIQGIFNWYNGLDRNNKAVVKFALTVGALYAAIGLAATAMKIFMGVFAAANALFIASPIGLITTAIIGLVAAIALLWDDYQTWKEGGKAFIDWEKWAPGIEKALYYIDKLSSAFSGLRKSTQEYNNIATNILGEKIPALKRRAESDGTFGGQLSSGTANFFDKIRPTFTGSGTAGGSLIGNLIGKGEGGYNSFNRGTAGDARGKTIDFSQMTVGQIMAAQSLPEKDPNRLFAVGKYQIIPDTLREAVDKLGVDPNAKFTPQLQEHIAHNYLFSGKRPDIKKFITGAGNLNSAIAAASMEFASVAHPKTGKSYYHGKGGNRASISAEQAANALIAMKGQYGALIGQGNSPSAAWQALGAPSMTSGSSLGMSQTNNITITGSSNPEETRRAVTGAINDANSRLQRNSASMAR